MMEKNELSEEVTVTPVIKDLERLFNRFIKLIGAIIARLFRGIQNIITFTFHYYIILTIVVLIGGAVGFFSTQIIPRSYESSMIVKLNVDAREQLKNDVGYFNALIQKENKKELSEILGLSEAEAGYLSSCEVYPFSNVIERTQALNDIYKMTDTAIFNTLDPKNLINTDQDALSAKYQISFQASDPAIFSKLEVPVMNYLERVPELNVLLKAGREGLKFQREILLTEMNNLDTLKKVMNVAMIEDAKSSGNGGTQTLVSLGDDQNSNQSVSILDIQDRSLFYARQISKIDVALQEHATCYFVTSHLTPYGKKIGYGSLSRGIISAFVFFVTTLLLLFFYRHSKTAA